VITQYFMNWASILLAAFISIFPPADPTISANIANARTVLVSYFWGLNWIIPIDTFLSVFQIVIISEGLVFAIKIVKFILRNLTFGVFKG
jgi:hypothetical protein